MSSFDTITIPRSKRRISVASDVFESFETSAESVFGSESSIETFGTALQPLGTVTEEAVREAYERGIDEGSRRTTELLQSQYALRVDEECRKIDQLFTSIQRALSSQSKETETALFTFAVGVAEHIVRREVELDKDVLLNIMKDGIRKIVGVEKMKIRIHPSDLAFVQENKHTIQSVSDSLREITFEPDQSVEPGGCTIESDIGNVDARIATQLEQVKDVIGKHS